MKYEIENVYTNKIYINYFVKPKWRRTNLNSEWTDINDSAWSCIGVNHGPNLNFKSQLNWVEHWITRLNSNDVWAWSIRTDFHKTNGKYCAVFTYLQTWHIQFHILHLDSKLSRCFTKQNQNSTVMHITCCLKSQWPLAARTATATI